MKVSATNTEVRQLLPVVPTQRDVVDQHQHVPDPPLSYQLDLLRFQSRHEVIVPVVELEILEPPLLHEGVKLGVAMLRSHKADEQVELA